MGHYVGERGRIWTRELAGSIRSLLPPSCLCPLRGAPLASGIFPAAPGVLCHCHSLQLQVAASPQSGLGCSLLTLGRRGGNRGLCSPLSPNPFSRLYTLRFTSSLKVWKQLQKELRMKDRSSSSSSSGLLEKAGFQTSLTRLASSLPLLVPWLRG